MNKTSVERLQYSLTKRELKQKLGMDPREVIQKIEWRTDGDEVVIETTVK